MLEDSLRSLFPAIQNINPEGAANMPIDTLAARLKAETTAQQGKNVITISWGVGQAMIKIDLIKSL